MPYLRKYIMPYNNKSILLHKYKSIVNNIAKHQKLNGLQIHPGRKYIRFPEVGLNGYQVGVTVPCPAIMALNQ